MELLEETSWIPFWLLVAGVLAPFVAFLFTRTSFSWHQHSWDFLALRSGRSIRVYDGHATNQTYWFYHCKCGAYTVTFGVLGNMSLTGKNENLPYMTRAEKNEFINKIMQEVFGECQEISSG